MVAAMPDMFIVAVFVVGYLLLSWLVLRGGTGSVSSRGRHWDDGRPRWVRVELPCAPCTLAKRAVEARPGIYEQWMSRRADEAPFFARLAAEMGLGYALGVAA